MDLANFISFINMSSLLDPLLGLSNWSVKGRKWAAAATKRHAADGGEELSGLSIFCHSHPIIS